MADVKISALPAASTPLAGTEVLPIVQSSATKKVSIADVTAGRTISSAGYQLGSSGIITETTTARTLSAGDNGKVIYCTNGSAITIKCDAGLGAGFSCTIVQAGAGQITIDANGQTLISYSSLVKTMGQYAVISVICPVANTFLLAGNLGV